MGEIGGNTGSVDNIVQSQLVDEGTGLEEEGQRLEERCAVSFRVRLRGLYQKIEQKQESIPVQYLRRHQQQLSRQNGQYHGLHTTTMSHGASSLDSFLLSPVRG